MAGRRWSGGDSTILGEKYGRTWLGASLTILPTRYSHKSYLLSLSGLRIALEISSVWLH